MLIGGGGQEREGRSNSSWGIAGVSAVQLGFQDRSRGTSEIGFEVLVVFGVEDREEQRQIRVLSSTWLN